MAARRVLAVFIAMHPSVYRHWNSFGGINGGRGTVADAISI
jgi:hypothetical protein